MQNIKHSIGKITGIYCIKNILNNKCYVGSSKHIYYRIKRHLSDLRKNNHKNPKLQNAFNKHGEDLFITEIIEKTNDLQNREEYWIKNIKPFYNCVIINIQRLEFSELQKKRISDSMKKAIKEGRASCNKKAVDVFDIIGNKIDTLESIAEFARKYDIRKPKAVSLFNGKFKQWKGYRIFPKGRYDTIEEYILPKKGCMKITKDKYNSARIKSDKVLETPGEDNQQPS